MAQPAFVPDQPHQLPLSDVRNRLTVLARMTALTGDVTVIVDGGRPVAALVPADAARSRAEARSAASRQEASARGWQERLETARRHLRTQHRRQVAELQAALRQAWRLVDAVPSSARDRAVADLRPHHRALLTDPAD